MSYVPIEWARDKINYITTRSHRYLNALDIDPDWTQEVVDDRGALQFVPAPGSRIGAMAIVGWSQAAGRVLVVIAYEDMDGNLHGINCWPASGRMRAAYRAAQSEVSE